MLNVVSAELSGPDWKVYSSEAEPFSFRVSALNALTCSAVDIPPPVAVAATVKVIAKSLKKYQALDPDGTAVSVAVST